MDESLNRDQLIALVQRLLQADDHDEEECDQLLETLQEQVSDPEVSSYIFWPDGAMTAGNIIDRALAHQPMNLHWSPDR